MTARDTTLAPDRLARLRSHLMTEIATAPTSERAAPSRRWTPRRALAGVAALAVIAVAAFVGVSVTGGPAGLGPAAFAVTQLPGGTVAIHVVDDEATAAQMTRQLHAQGLNITIESVPTTPQLVGTWVWSSGSADAPRSLLDSIADQTHGYVATIEVPATFPGSITLGVGRATRPGETPQVAGARNALAPGGLLFCDRLSGADPSVAARTLAAAGYTVHWADGVVSRPVDAPPAGARVTQAFVFDFDPKNVERPIADPHDVTVVVAQPSQSRYLPELWTGFSLSQRDAGTADYTACARG